MSIGKFLRIKKLTKNKTELIQQFKSDLNGASDVEEISTIVVNLSSKIGYFDCVMYVFDDERKFLIQKAVFGPKSDKDATILQPITLGLDRGIVGSVASSGKSEIIHNTLSDKRYFIDDDIRLSEITIPVIYNQTVIGVIDAEHPKQNFFSDIDLNFWEEIALILAPILNDKIEEDKQN